MTAGKLTVITGELPNILGKVICLKNGTLTKETAGPLCVGTYAVREFSSADELVALLESVDTGQCISSSLPLPTLPQSGRLVAKSLQAEHPGAITRTKADMGFRRGVPGILTLDYDPQPGDVVLSRAELWSLLQEAISGVALAGVIHWHSGSSHIWNGDAELHGQRGQRLYVLVADAADIPRAAETLAARLW